MSAGGEVVGYRMWNSSLKRDFGVRLGAAK
jgi:hypothetical protein